MLYELRNPDEAQRFLLHGLWLQLAVAPTPAAVRRALEWALEIASAGDPLPPVGVVADVGHIALAFADAQAAAQRPALSVPEFSAGLARTYEDYVLGRLYADGSFERGAAALARYQGRDRAKGLAFLIARIRERAQVGGVQLNPAVVKMLAVRPPEEVLAEGWESIHRDGLDPLLLPLYEQLLTNIRNVGELLGPEDVFELEHGTALAGFGQRVALRQTLQAAAALEPALAERPRAPRVHRRQVATRILDEDLYPVGGFVSISTRGTIESLLHSQLAYMERDDVRPDLFDIKFLRDELLYYSRDENQFFRRRRFFVIALYPELDHTRVKDPHAPYQRIILLLGLLVTALRKSIEWLASDALLFEIVFIEPEASEDEFRDQQPLAPERALLELIFREQAATGTVAFAQMPRGRVSHHAAQRARRGMCQVLELRGSTSMLSEIDGCGVSQLSLAAPLPELTLDVDEFDRDPPDGTDPLEPWRECLARLVGSWL